MRAASVRDQYQELVHPAHPLDIPVPGFPSHAALVAWAKTKDSMQIEEAAVDTLRKDEWPQQYAAMALLRELGVGVEGDGFGDSFRWIVDKGGEPEIVVPRAPPHAGYWGADGSVAGTTGHPRRGADASEGSGSDEGAAGELWNDIQDVAGTGSARQSAGPSHEAEHLAPDRQITAEEWNGVILDVADGGFVARLHLVDDEFTEQEAMFSMAEVAPVDRPAVRPGVVVQWHTAVIEEQGGRFVHRSFLVFPSLSQPTLADRLAGKRFADQIERLFGAPLSA